MMNNRKRKFNLHRQDTDDLEKSERFFGHVLVFVSILYGIGISVAVISKLMGLF